MTDMLEWIRTDLDQRLAELRPSVEEYDRLLRAVDALDGVVALGTPSPASAGPAATGPGPRRRRVPAPAAKRRPAGATRARPGQTQQRVIDVLRAKPGSTSAAVAKAVGISTNAAAATISRLLRQDRVQRGEAGGYSATTAAAGATAAPAEEATPARAPDSAAAE